MNQAKARIALDVGEKRIGVATGDGIVKIARPLTTVAADGNEIEEILKLANSHKAKEVIIGYPRNQSGEPTAQTGFVVDFKDRLAEKLLLPIIFQDESLTSVLAEEHLRSSGKPYQKDDIDAMAAAMILQDYLEK